MGTSAFCWFANQTMTKADAARDSHRRCPGLSCDCTCHEPNATATRAEHTQGEDVTLEELRNHQTASNGAAPEVAAVVPGKRRTFTEEQKHAIAREYSEAPAGTSGEVVARYGLTYNSIVRWCNQFGIATPGRGSNRSGTKKAARTTGSDGAAPPEPKPTKPAADVGQHNPGVAAELLIDAEIDAETIALTFEPHELDVLDACAFLEGVDRYELIGGLITEWIQMHAEDGDVKLCLAARRGRRADAA